MRTIILVHSKKKKIAYVQESNYLKALGRQLNCLIFRENLTCRKVTINDFSIFTREWINYPSRVVNETIQKNKQKFSYFLKNNHLLYDLNNLTCFVIIYIYISYKNFHSMDNISITFHNYWQSSDCSFYCYIISLFYVPIIFIA